NGYLNIVTPYAFRFVKSELENRNQVEDHEERGSHVFVSGHWVFNSSAAICNCQFRVAISLSCSHIFVDGAALVERIRTQPQSVA
ncbi:hypothetical protein LSAT2_018768, partial [Lamellibrachia satsuma]